MSSTICGGGDVPARCPICGVLSRSRTQGPRDESWPVGRSRSNRLPSAPSCGDACDRHDGAVSWRRDVKPGQRRVGRSRNCLVGSRSWLPRIRVAASGSRRQCPWLHTLEWHVRGAIHARCTRMGAALGFARRLGQQNPTPSIPAREQRQVDRSIVGDHPPLEYNAARAGYFKTIAVRSRLAGVSAKFTVWAVKGHEFSQTGQ